MGRMVIGGDVVVDPAPGVRISVNCGRLAGVDARPVAP